MILPFLWILLSVVQTEGIRYENVTVAPASRQLLDFRLEHLKPIGLWTSSDGHPVDIRDTTTVNSDMLTNHIHFDLEMSFDGERIPERVVHAKGTGALGYFVVTNDVSKYTKAELFNGIGKKTPIVVRFSSSTQNMGGTDLLPEMKGMAIKFYTKDGNLDLLCLQPPVYFYRDAFLFYAFAHSVRRNPQTNLYDFNQAWDFFTLKPEVLHAFLWTQSDYGIPNGYRKMNAFPIHTYEIYNKKGDKYYVRFNFRTQQGLDNLTRAEAMEIQGQDLDYYGRDLYNAIEQGNYPAWILEMDILNLKELQRLDYDPFDVTRLWKNGTYSTVTIGQLVVNSNVDNMFRTIEQSAFNPGNLVPGISGPYDTMFKARRVFYRDTQNHRLGTNHNKIDVNTPLYYKTYIRDGKSPVRENMKNAPNYYPNSFNGPIPYVDESTPSEKLLLFQSNAVDLEPCSYFYNFVLENEGQRQRLINNLALSLVSVTSPVLERAIKFMYLIDRDLGRRVAVAVELARAAAEATARARAARNVERTPSVEPQPSSDESNPVKLKN